MISRYDRFVLENTAEDLESKKESLVGELDKLKDKVLDNIEMRGGKLIYHDFENIDVDDELKKISGSVGEDTVESFNVESFLRKINQIMDLFQSDTIIKIESSFADYYKSLDRRIETLAGEEKRSSYDVFYDEWEGEKSVLSRKQFEREKFDLQVELLKLQEWVKKEKKKIVIVFEGRDTAGKGSTIKRFVEYLDPKGFKVVALGMPTDWERDHWFERYENHMPKPGEIVFFDRSWHNRSVVEPAMGYCTEEQYKDFMDKVNDWESGLVNSGVILIKFWFSITREKQLQRFDLRMKSPLKYWKFSPNDAKVINKWDLITFYKKQMFAVNSTNKCPWTIVNTNDKKVGILNSIRYVLDTINYEGKNPEHTKYYPEVVSVLR
jgi:polyphosphate kinase 2